MDFAFQHFGQIQHGLPRVQAICDWVHKNIEYRFGAGSPYTSASEVIAQRYGVCRDFAHTAVALCRCFNLPARYVTGYVPDVAFLDPGSPMDFHAYMEVYLGWPLVYLRCAVQCAAHRADQRSRAAWTPWMARFQRITALRG